MFFAFFVFYCFLFLVGSRRVWFLECLLVFCGFTVGCLGSFYWFLIVFFSGFMSFPIGFQVVFFSMVF